MNPVEQKAHTKRTDQLAGELEALETLHLETARRVALLDDQTGWAVARCKDLGRSRDSFESVLKRIEDVLYATRVMAEDAVSKHWKFTERGFWGRLRWLLTGR